MKILSTTDGSFLKYLYAHGIFAELMSYDDVYESVPDEDMYDALIVDISGDNAEGVMTPRSLIGNGHTLPIIGILDELEVIDERDFESVQTTFIDQGGMYLVKNTSNPDLMRAYITQASTVGGKRFTQRLPVRVYNTGDVELKVDLRTRSVSVNKLPIHLTIHEYLFLELLVLRTGMVVTKEAVIGHLYNGIDSPEIKIVDVFLCKIRGKLGDAGQFIETVWGSGYLMLKTIQKEEIVV